MIAASRPHRVTIGLVAAFGFAAFTLMSSTAVSAEMWNDGDNQGLSESDLIPKLSSEEAYTERYNFSAQLDSGGFLKVKFVISNLGWGDLQGAVRVVVKHPKHDNYTYKKRLARKKWSSADDKLKLSIADTTLTRPKQGVFRIKHDGKASVSATFKNRLDMWQPGNGELKSGSSYYRSHLLAPRASVSGSAELGGEEVDISSSNQGVAEHMAMNVAPYNLARRNAWFRTFEGDVTINWKFIDLTSKFGGGTASWIIIGYNGRIVYSSAAPNLKFGKFRPDGPSGYRVPRAAQIESKSDGDSIEFTQRGTTYHRKNLMKQWGPVVSKVASSVTNPYRFTVPGSYSFEMSIQGTTAKVSGKQAFKMDILNSK